MTAPDPLAVTWIPAAVGHGWMAGMDLPWPHRALLMWTPLDGGDESVDTRLRHALWAVLASGDRVVGMPEQTGVSQNPLQWVFGQPGRAQFDMRWTRDPEVFEALLDGSLFFAASFDADAERPLAADLAFWHDQADPPDALFPPGQRAVIRSGVDGFCIGVFCADAAGLKAFRTALAAAVGAAGGTLVDGDEPGT